MAAVLADWARADPDLAAVGAAERHVALKLPGSRRREWLIGRLTARAALRLMYGDIGGRAEVLRDESCGAPVVRGLPPCLLSALSLSHTGDRAACVVADRDVPIGIDVEQRDLRNQQLLRRIVGLGECPPRGIDATLVWSVKEAAFKAQITGPASLKNYPVDWRRPAPAVTIIRDGRPVQLCTWTYQWGETVVAIVGPAPATLTIAVMSVAA